MPTKAGRIPAPLVQSYVVCREIIENARTKEVILVGPFHGVPLPVFPANLRCSVFAQFSGGHGTYPIRLVFTDPIEAAIWAWQPGPVVHVDPLEPHHLILHDVELPVPGPGEYRLALELGGEVVAEQRLRFIPAG